MQKVQGNLDLLATGRIPRLLWDYSIPAVVGMLVMSLYNVIDRIFIGQGVGTEAIAGLAITFPVSNVSAALGVLIGAGASARVSILLGAGDKEGALLTLGNSLTLILINATIYISFFALFLDDILVAFGASEASLPYAHDFMSFLLPGMLVMNIGFSFNNIMRASGYPRKAMNSMFLGAGANLVLAPIFIFGLDMGIKGAAIATDIAMTIFTVYVMHHFIASDSTLTFRRGTFRLQWRIILGIIGIGAAPSLINLASSAINVLINTSLFRYGGDNAVAAAGIFSTFTSLLCMAAVGICQGMQPIIVYNYGAGLFGRLRSTYLLASGCATVITTIGCVIGLAWPEAIARAFTVDPELIKVTAEGLRRAMIMFWIVGFQIISTSLFQSIGKVGKSIFLSLSRQVIFLIPLLLFLPSEYGLKGVWLSFPISDLMATIATLICIIWQFRQLSAMQRRNPGAEIASQAPITSTSTSPAQQ